MKICKCHSPKIKRVGNCYMCCFCKCIIIKIRTTFYRKTTAKPRIKKYSRSKEKIQARKEIEDYDDNN